MGLEDLDYIWVQLLLMEINILLEYSIGYL